MEPIDLNQVIEEKPKEEKEPEPEQEPEPEPQEKSHNLRLIIETAAIVLAIYGLGIFTGLLVSWVFL